MILAKETPRKTLAKNRITYSIRSERGYKKCANHASMRNFVKFSEEQVTEMMQYVTDLRSTEYEILKQRIKEDMERNERGYMNIPVADFYLFGECMIRIGKISSMYRLLNKVGALNYDEFVMLQDEVYDKFDMDNIRTEIRNQRSLEK